QILLARCDAGIRLHSTPVVARIVPQMIDKGYDLSRAAHYHTGAFPPPTLDYQLILGPLEDAAASLARYDAKMSSLVNSELLLAPLRRQDAVSSSRMEGTISTVENIYLLEAEEDAGSP